MHRHPSAAIEGDDIALAAGHPTYHVAGGEQYANAGETITQGSAAIDVSADEVALYQVRRGEAVDVNTVPVVARDDIARPSSRPTDGVACRIAIEYHTIPTYCQGQRCRGIGADEVA